MTNKNDKQDVSAKRNVHKPIIGGEGTILPEVIESFLSWLLCLTCLLVSGYYYCINRYRIYQRRGKSHPNQSEGNNIKDIFLVPLTTSSKQEMHSTPCIERLNQLECYLREKFGYNKNNSSENELINYIRSDLTCRRLATLAMCFDDNVVKYDPENDLALTLISIWPSLLSLPITSEKGNIKISVVITAFRENGKSLIANLNQMFLASHNPKSVEIVLVDAGQNKDFDNILLAMQQNPWGNVNCKKATLSGRGQCFNYGASFATGYIITFCHADIIVPKHWDTSILRAFRNNNIPSSATIANCCTFSFGINRNKHIPGLKAVEYTANVRCKLYHLPYGDQVLSMPKNIFEYIGGFPNQALMEDYVLIDVLRKRSFYLQANHQKQKETISLLSDIAYCSPRRWEKLGVLYVTFMNSKIVHWYNSNEKSIEQLYEIYYGTCTKEATMKSPWEVHLDKIIKSNKNS